MNKTAKIVIGLGLLYYGFLRGAQALVVGLKDYTFSGIDVAKKSVRLTFRIYVRNPLFIGLKLKGIKGDVYMQGVNVGSVNMDYDYFLSGRKTHVIPVEVQLRSASLSEAMIQNISTGDVSTLNVAFDGNLIVTDKNVNIPLQINLGYGDLTK